jgi:hypothetical protein
MFRFLLMATDKAERGNKFQFRKPGAYPQYKNDAPCRMLLRKNAHYFK